MNSFPAILPPPCDSPGDESGFLCKIMAGYVKILLLNKFNKFSSRFKEKLSNLAALSFGCQGQPLEPHSSRT